MYNIRYTELAEADLAELFQLIYEDKPMSAIEYIDKLDIFITLLEDNPYMGIECKQKKIDKDCRVLVYENYLIFYIVKQEEIVIIRILNAHNSYTDKIH
ncbi:MAG TPA: type II toxin-antitoxin system RelE/ParE family toxin [Epsilonproteobacteria bacterium]|nr:type II toxin-antitoxin system RelE/ParE family toxin [Campylobacterota bacterium]